MQMSYLYVSDFPFKNFCKLAKQTGTKKNYQKQGLVMIKIVRGTTNKQEDLLDLITAL